MTVTIDENETGRPTVKVSCDGCGASPTDEEIIKRGGLVGLGWKLAGHTYHCPSCKENCDA